MKLAGSDAASADFLKNALPTMQSLVGENLRELATGKDEREERGERSAGGWIALNPNAVKLSTAADVRAYFVGENAGYHNTLGFNTLGFGVAGTGLSSDNALLIFPDASCSQSYYSSEHAARTENSPLFPGDFVDMGRFDAGVQLDFFLIAAGASGNRTEYFTNGKLNPDALGHMVAFAQVNSPYVLIGFEDLLGSDDQDYNDLLIAVYFGEKNVQSMIQSASLHGVPAPEPGCLAAIVVACGGWLYRVRRKRRQSCACAPARLHA